MLFDQEPVLIGDVLGPDELSLAVQIKLPTASVVTGAYGDYARYLPS